VATRRQKIEVGVFLTVAIAIAVAVLAALIGVGRTELVTYRVEFQENVAGLTEGSKVTYQGVPVGKVTNVRITEDNVISIRIGIDPDKVKLRKDVQAMLTMETVFGPVAIDLYYPADRHQDPLPPGSFIPSESSLRERIQTDIPRTLEKLAVVMTRLDQTLAAVEPRRVAETVDSLSSVVQQFDATLSRIRPADVERILGDVDKVLKSTDAGLTELRGDIDKLATALQDAVKTGSGELTQTTRNINQSLERLNKAVDQTSQLVQSVNQVVEKNRKTVASSLQHIDSVLAKADKQLDGMDLPAAEKSFRDAAGSVDKAADSVDKAADGLRDAAQTVAQSRQDLRRSLDNVERSVTRTLDELERTLASARRLIDVLERDPSALIRGKTQPPRK
jgi:phospholipid/cholesterol/gamma-HCH transport system substrate-binding protein